MTNWQAVANHLATEVMQWHIDNYFWTDNVGNTKMSRGAWKPYENWGQIGRVIDEMKKHRLHLALLYTGVRNKFVAYFYECNWNINGLEDLGLGQPENCVSQDTELKAIALAAALATRYVEREKTEAEILFDKLFKEGLYRMKDIEEHILELFEQSFERVREKENKDTVDYEHLRKVFKAAVRLRRKLIWHDNLAYRGKVTTSKEQSALDDLLMETRWVENEWGGQV